MDSFIFSLSLNLKDAVVINNSLKFFPPKTQLVMQETGNSILSTNLPSELYLLTQDPPNIATHKSRPFFPIFT